jgi:hypothetical protein
MVSYGHCLFFRFSQSVLHGPPGVRACSTVFMFSTRVAHINLAEGLLTEYAFYSYKTGSWAVREKTAILSSM